MKKENDEIYDVVIVGGGMVGSSLALSIAQLPLKVAIIEPYQQNSKEAPGFDARAIALSWGSSRIYNGLGLWPQIKPMATPIKHIHISDKGHPGICRLKAKEQNVSAMGQVVELETMGKIIHQALSTTKTKIFCPAEVLQIHSDDDFSRVEFKTEKDEIKEIKTKLVVAADGNNSQTRKLLDINTEEKPYAQVAVISTIETQLSHQNIAYERFTEMGPVAFLPLSNDRISLVWMMAEEVAAEIKVSTDDEFIGRLQAQFGQRLGKITRVGSRTVYPLNLIKAVRCIDKRLAMIGNAAQSLHPIAGQGFNLGLRDVACLADSLRKACLENIDPGSADLLQQYEQWREPDRQKMMSFTDTLARLFTNPSKLLSGPRNITLMSMNLFPQMRNHLADTAMGLAGKQPRLVRGLSMTIPSAELSTNSGGGH